MLHTVYWTWARIQIWFFTVNLLPTIAVFALNGIPQSLSGVLLLKKSFPCHLMHLHNAGIIFLCKSFSLDFVYILFSVIVPFYTTNPYFLKSVNICLELVRVPPPPNNAFDSLRITLKFTFFSINLCICSTIVA